MITGMHALIYARDAEKARTFFRDVLGWPHVDAGHGWLIFALPPSEAGVHPPMAGMDDADEFRRALPTNRLDRRCNLIERPSD